MKRSFILIILLWCFAANLFASNGTVIDSLKNIVSGNQHDTLKLFALGELGMQHYLFDLKTARSFWEEQLELAQEIEKDYSGPELFSVLSAKANAIGSVAYVLQCWGQLDSAIILSDSCLYIFERIGDLKGVASLLNNLGVIHNVQGNNAEALKCYERSYAIQDSIKYPQGAAMALNNMALIYNNLGNIPKALDYHHRSLKISEQIEDQYSMGHAYNNLGIIYRQQGELEKGIEYFEKSFKVREKINDLNGMALALNELGGAFMDKKDFEKALSYHKQSLQLREELGDSAYIGQSLINIGVVLIKDKEYKSALEYFTKALRLKESVQEYQGVADACDHIAGAYWLLGDLKNAELYGTRALKIVTELNFPGEIRSIAEQLSQIYADQGKYKESLEMHRLFKQMSDSIYNESNRKATLQQQLRYEFEKKAIADSVSHANEIQIKNLELAKKDAEAKKQKIVIYSFIVGFVIIVLFTVLLLRLFIQKKKANVLLAHQNEEILSKNEEITSQRDEIEAQRDEIESQRDRILEQKDLVEVQKQEIVDSINYALRIQNAVLSAENAMSAFHDHFILFKPKDIVSGDFYWSAKTGDRIVVAVADCTGHGVPGAFMSMLGVSFLNEIVKTNKVFVAAEILNSLRTHVVQALNQKGGFADQKDGMDISLISISNENALWAGANNPLYIIRKEEAGKALPTDNENPDQKESGLLEYKPDKMPIGIHERMDSFTNHEIFLKKGDRIYLFSDGLPDQFGGPKGKKLKYKKFKELLSGTYGGSMRLQGEKLVSEAEDWMQGNPEDYEQVDDITIVGIEI